MSLPNFHSYTWSDIDEEEAAPLAALEPTPDGPLGLLDKELRLWVTYPDKKRKRAKRKRKASKSGPSKRSLWAVIIVEEINKQDDFAYEVTLKRIHRKGDRLIKVLVRNDPSEQSEDATVFGFLSSCAERLDALEQQLSMCAAKRVYDAIAETWAGGH